MLRFYDQIRVQNKNTIVSKFLALDDDTGHRVKTFFGNSHEPRAAMLNISNAYKENGRWQFRIWGWLPEKQNNAGIDRNALLKGLHRLVTQDTDFWDDIFGSNAVDLNQTIWRELDSTGHGRNHPMCSIFPTTTTDFLRCLLTEEQKI